MGTQVRRRIFSPVQLVDSIELLTAISVVPLHFFSCICRALYDPDLHSTDGQPKPVLTVFFIEKKIAFNPDSSTSRTYKSLLLC